MDVWNLWVSASKSLQSLIDSGNLETGNSSFIGNTSKQLDLWYIVGLQVFDRDWNDAHFIFSQQYLD